MIAKSKTLKRIKKLRKIIIRTFAIIVLLLLIIVIVFSIPSVQTYVAKKVTENLNETYGTDINIQRLGLNWRGEVDVREVYIADHHQDTLIYAKQLQTNIINFRNLISGDLGFGNIDLETAKLYVKTYQGEEYDNLYIFSEKFNTEEPKSESPFSLFSNDISLRNSKVKILDENLEEPEILNLTGVNLVAEDFKIAGVEVFAAVQSLSLDAQRGFVVNDAKADFSYTADAMKLLNLELATKGSLIKGDIVLNYGEEGLGDFVNGVEIDARLEDAEIATNDLNAFYNEFGPDQTILIDAAIKGNMNNLSLTETRLRTGNTDITGTFKLENLMSQEAQYSVSAYQHTIQTNYYDLRRFMPNLIGSTLPEQLKELGNFTFTGDTEITPTELGTKSKLTTSIGNADVLLAMGKINDFENATYKGNAKIKGFNLGKMVGTKSLGKLTGDLNFDGSGFTQNTVNTELRGKISEFTFEGYRYTNITVSGNLKNPVFDGDLVIDDPNIQMEFKGLIDVSQDYNQYDFEADVQYAELNKLNLIARDSVSVFAGNIVMDMRGTSIDDAEGTIEFLQTFYQNESEDYYFDDFLIIASNNETERTIQIISPDIVNGNITGNFKLAEIPNLFQNSVYSLYTNYIPLPVEPDQYFSYNFKIFNKIIDVFVPQIQLGENTNIRGKVSSEEKKFELDFRSPELLLYENYFGNVKLQVDNDNPLYNAFISVDSIYTGGYNFTEFNLINKTFNDTLFVQTEFKGGRDKTDNFDLSLYHTINPDNKSVVGFRKSEILYKDNSWYINQNNRPSNRIVFDNDFSNIQIDSLVINHENEFIRMAGQISDSTYKDLKLRFENVNIGHLVPEVDSLDMSGNMNGKLDFLQKDGSYYPNSEVTIDDIIINKIPFGDLNLLIKGNEDLTKYNINTTLVREDVKSIDARGEIDLNPSEPQINLNVNLNEFNLAAVSPFGGEVITNIRGLATGNARVTGSYKSPDILGRIVLFESGLKIPYLNTDFDIADNTIIDIGDNTFTFQNTTITDTKYSTQGVLSGGASHKNFGDWEMTLDISTDRLLVLDTPPDEDALYYGTAFISGTANIDGPVDELVINVSATTEEGTTFKIPLSDTESIGSASFIHFLSPEEKQAIINGETYVAEEVKGLELNFDLDINQNAEVEVVVDQVNNSTVKGRGAGILLLEINTLGKFNMWGDFLVTEGQYDFRYGGIIQKNFQVVPGGNITWDGDPTRARLNLSAKYSTEANPSVLLDNPSINTDIPVEVVVDLSGEIIQPDLNFNINFPRVSSIVRSELEYKLQNEDERQKQALFLVASGQFVNDDFQGTNAFTGTLVDRVSGLVNELFADQDGKFKLGLDYQQGQRLPTGETSDRFGVALTSQISERVLINGKVGVPVGGVNENTVVGDVEVQWLINDDGSLRMTFFNRQADIQFIGEDQIYEQGIGMSYSVDFDTFSELVEKLFNKKLTLESDEEIPVVPDDNEEPPVNFNNDATKEDEE